MATFKVHLAGTTKTKDTGRDLPICGKVSFGIEYDTLTKEEFEKKPIQHRCKNCNNKLLNN